MERHDRTRGVERLRRFELFERSLNESRSVGRPRVDADSVESALGQPLDECAVPAADVYDPRAARQSFEDERVETAPPPILNRRRAHSTAARRELRSSKRSRAIAAP
jgi:hypothetical protein